MDERALVIVDERVPVGEFQVGGAVLFRRGATDQEIGWSVTATPMRVHDEGEAANLEAELDRLRVSHRRFDRERGRFADGG